MQSITYGIDLGSSNCVAAIWKNGNIEILVSKVGSRQFPSCVAYNKRNPTQIIVGHFAKQKMQTTSYGVFHHVRDLLGVSYDHPMVTRMRGSVGYDISGDDEGKLVVAIQTETGDIVKHPEDVEVMILSAIAEEMKVFAGCDIQNAVITVPAYFDQYKRDLTKLAGQIAGLNVRAVISEPLAAVYAYLDFTNEERNSTIMIYDLGDCEFNVSIVRYEGDQFTELATDGDMYCGCLDFDILILDLMKKEYEKQTGEPIPAKLIPKVLSNCEQAKITLLNASHTEIDITNDVIISFSRAEMNRLIGPNLENTIKICDRAIAAAKISVTDIDNIILVGGSTRLQLVGELLRRHFPTIPIKGNISPDNCVAYGAAKYGHNLDLHSDMSMPQPELDSVPVFSPPPVPSPSPVPDSLSSVSNIPGSIEQYILLYESKYPRLPLYDEYDIDNMIRMKEQIASDENGNVRNMNRCKLDIGIPNRGRVEVLIPRNTVLPVTKKKLICLKDSYQSIMHISIYQGNDSIAKNNVELYRLEVKLEQHKDAYLLIVLDMDEERCLSVKVVDYNTGDSYEHREIQTTMTQEELRNRQKTFEQERKTRNRFLALDTIRNRLQKWGFSLIEKGASEEDQMIIKRANTRLEDEQLTEQLTDEVYTILSDISEE